MDAVALTRLRRVGFYEGLSFVVLLFVAMPLKYGFDQPLPVRIVGMAHGALFLLYLYLLVQTAAERAWPLRRTALGFVAALMPFGPFVFDAVLRREADDGGETASS
jgi:integral membrane protein